MKRTAYRDSNEESIWLYLLNNAKQSSRALGRRKNPLEFSITLEDIKNQFKKQKGLCYWFGKPLNKDHNFVSFNPLAISIDRLDNNQGYNKDNIVLCFRFANLGRGKCDSKIFKEIINFINK